MFSVNKKLWSFNFGCILAGSFVWLVGVGAQAPVPEQLIQQIDFVHNYYNGVVTAGIATISTLLMLMVMQFGFKICISEHPFWVLIPSVFFVLLTFVTANELLALILFAALPSMSVVCAAAIFRRLTRRKRYLRSKNTG